MAEYIINETKSGVIKTLEEALAVIKSNEKHFKKDEEDFPTEIAEFAGIKTQ